MPGCQKLQIDGLTRSSTGCFIAVVPIGISGRQWVNAFSVHAVTIGNVVVLTDDSHRQSAGCLSYPLYWHHSWLHGITQGQGTV